METRGVRHFEDGEVQVEVAGSPCHGILVASNALGSHAWEAIEPGELMVVRDGAIRFRTHSPGAVERALPQKA